MSYVTDVLVVADYVGPEFEKLLTAPWGWGHRQQALRKIDMDGAGGTKYFCSDVYAAGANYLDREEFLGWIGGLPWMGQAIVYLCSEGDARSVYLVGPSPEREWMGL